MHNGGSKKYRFHPIVFSLWCVLTKAKDPDRRRIVDRADLEIRAAGAGLVIANHSGTPWEQYAAHWQEMLPPTRESFAASQIVPNLRGALTPAPAPAAPQCHPLELEDHPPATPEEQGQIRELIRSSLSSSRISPSSTGSTPAPAPIGELALDGKDLLLLARARDTVKARCVDDP